MMSASNRLKPVFLALIAAALDALTAHLLLFAGTPSTRCQEVADGDLECVVRAGFRSGSAVRDGWEGDQDKNMESLVR